MTPAGSDLNIGSNTSSSTSGISGKVFLSTCKINLAKSIALNGKSASVLPLCCYNSSKNLNLSKNASLSIIFYLI